MGIILPAYNISVTLLLEAEEGKLIEGTWKIFSKEYKVAFIQNENVRFALQNTAYS